MVKWIVAGVGDIARKRVIPAILSEPRSSLVGVVTRDAAKAKAYSGARAWPTIEAALQEGAADAVYIALPVALHAPATLACLGAGIPVLCEKPMAMDFEEAQKMVEAAEEFGVLFGVAYYRRLFPKLLRAKRLIGEGAIGQPVLAEANCHGWLESEERGWLRDPALAGGGPLYDIASHRIDAMNFLFGRPRRALGLLSNTVHSLEVEDSATVTIQYDGGIHGVVDVRWNSRVRRDQFRVVGTDGEIGMDPLSGLELRVGDRVERLPTHANVHYPLIENYVDALESGAALAAPGEQAMWTDWVIDQAMHLRATG
jgi:predicted dehydrogenase